MKGRKIIAGTAAVLMIGSIFSGYGITAGAEGTEPRGVDIPIDAYASIGGWYHASTNNDWSTNFTMNDETIHLGGTDSGVTNKYSDSWDAARCDSKVSFVKFDVTGNDNVDKYILNLKYDSAVSERNGSYKLGCAIAYMNTTVEENGNSFIVSNGKDATTWETSRSYPYNWSNRPRVDTITMQEQVYEDGQSPIIDITDLLQGKTGEVTIAIFSEPELDEENKAIAAEYYYTPSITAIYNVEEDVSEGTIEYTEPVEKVIDDTTETDKNSVGFVGKAKVTGTAQVGFELTAQKNNRETVVKEWKYDTVITSENGATNIIFGLLITDLSDVGLDRENVTAEYLQ